MNNATFYDLHTKQFDITKDQRDFEYILVSNPCIVVDELIGALEYLSEIEKIGKKHIESKRSYTSYPINRHFLLFQGFMRQATAYYKSAELLDYRSSPLIYYYAFLNLVKAYCCLKDPKKFKSKISHGLTYSTSGEKFSKQKLRTQDGVFSVFYEQLFGVKIGNNKNLNILSLLSYCIDIGYEYQMGKYNIHKTLAAKAVLVGHNQLSKVWSILAISNYNELKKYPKYKNQFEKNFDQIDLSKNHSGVLFGFNGFQHSGFTYFESKIKLDITLPVSLSKMNVYDAFKDIINPIVNKSEFNLSLALPLSKKSDDPFNEILAIYSVMYYISSLIRYQPQYLEKILSSEESWLLQRFIKNTPQTFLRYMVQLIKDEDLIFQY